MYVEQRILTAVTDKKTVNFYVQWQVFLAFVSAIKNHRRMMERRKVEPSQIYIQIGSLVDFCYASLQDSRACSGCHQNYRNRNQQ